MDAGRRSRYGRRVARKPLPNASPRIKRVGKAEPTEVSGKRVTGRPCLMTALTVARFLDYVRDGMVIQHAEALCGLGTDTVGGWLERGRRDIEKRDLQLQTDGKMPKLSKWGNFAIAFANARASAQAECWGTLNEIRRTRGPSPGMDAAGKVIPGPILHPEVASSNAKWQLSRMDNMLFGAGSQRTDILKPGAGGPEGGGEDDAAIVMEILDRRLDRKLAQRDRTDGE